MATKVDFRNDQTGEIKSVKIGWSWTLFFFGLALGIPFWLRKVYPQAAAIVGWNLLCVVLSAQYDLLLTIGSMALSVFYGLQGNKITAEYYVKRGWAFADPDADEVAYARSKWAMA